MIEHSQSHSHEDFKLKVMLLKALSARDEGITGEALIEM
jgi:hypothetical protein